jgi:hypothetical protein
MVINKPSKVINKDDQLMFDALLITEKTEQR